MKTRITTLLGLLLSAGICPDSYAQQMNFGGGGAPTTFAVPATSTFSPSFGATGGAGGTFQSQSGFGGSSGMSGTGTGSATGSNTGGTAVITRPGFLSPVRKAGFLTPSNLNSTTASNLTNRAPTTGFSTLSTRLGAFPGGGFGGFGNQFGMNSNRNSTNANSTQQLRIPMRVASDSTALGPARVAVAVRFTDRISRLPGLERSQVTMTAVEGRTAVLRGKVASMEQSDQIARLALLEPGISQIQNELVIDSALAAPETLPGVAPPAANPTPGAMLPPAVAR